MRLPSASRLNRAMSCAASVTLPQSHSSSSAAERGTAVHRFLEDVGLGVPESEALSRVDNDEARRYCEALDVAQLPAGALQGFMAAEAVLTWNVRTGKGHIVPWCRSFFSEPAVRFKPGFMYDHRGTTWEYVGRADVIAINAAEKRGLVVDYKSGRGDYLAAEDDWQMRFLALALARAQNLDAVHVAKLYLSEDGVIRKSTALFDSFALDDFAEDLVKLRRRIVEQESSPTPTLGPHCQWCPALPACPAQVGLIRAAADTPVSLDSGVTPAVVAEAWGKAKLIERGLAEYKRQILAYAENVGEVDLGNGRVLGPVAVSEESLDGPKTRDVLVGLVGEEVAGKVVVQTATKERLKEAVRELWREEVAAWEGAGKKGPRPILKRALDRIHAELLAKDAVLVETTIRVKEHRTR